MDSNAHRVLLIRFGAFGDLVLALEAVKALKLSRYRGEIHFLTKVKFEPIIMCLIGECYSELLPRVRVHTVPDKASLWSLLSVLRNLRGYQYSFVYDLHSNLRSRISIMILQRPFLRISKGRFRELFQFIFRSYAKRFLGHSYRRSNEVVRMISPMGSFAIAARDVPIGGRMSAGSTDSRFIPLLSKLSIDPVIFKSRRIVCISSETAWLTKQWPEERFRDLSSRLILKGFHVVWLGLGKGLNLDPHKMLFDLRGLLALEDLVHLLKMATLTVCNDTGLMHLSEALGTPVVGIFGPTTTGLGFGPRLIESRIVEKPLWCRPCSKTGRFCHRPWNRQKCLKDISIDEVFQKVCDLVEK